MSLEIETINSIYTGETFSRKVNFKIDNVVQDVGLYTITHYAYKESKTCQDKVYDPATATDGTVLIPSTITDTMLGNYILIVIFDLAGFKTIRKVRFKVEGL